MDTGIVALVLVIIVIVVLIILAIIFASKGSNVATYGLAFKLIKGKTTDGSYTFTGNEMYIVPESMTTLKADKPKQVVTGNSFFINNQSNSKDFTLSSGTNAVVKDGTIKAGKSGLFYWSSDAGTIDRIIVNGS